MNKSILSLLLISSLVTAAEEQGSGTTPSAASNSNHANYQLMCTPVSNQNEENHCILIQIAEQE